MVLQYNMESDFFGMPGELLSDDCKHRTGFTHINSDLIKRNPDDSAIAHVHELECLTCGNTWRFAQKSLPAREHQNR